MIFARAPTALPIVRVAGKSWKTLASRAMIVGHALRIQGARERAAKWLTLEDSEGVRTTGLGCGTLVVRRAVRNGGFFAGGTYRVPLVRFLASAFGVTLRIRETTLMRTADDFAAGIHAVLDTVRLHQTKMTFRAVAVSRATRWPGGTIRLTSVYEVAWVSVKTVDAQTRGSVILCYAKRVRSALEFAARVYAFSHSFADLEANLLGLAVQVVGTMASQVTSFCLVVRVAPVARWTETSSILTHRPRATNDIVAFVQTFSIYARVIDRARNLLATLAVLGMFARTRLQRLALGERIPEETVDATAVVASDDVYANGVQSAGVSVTFVYVVALDERIASVTRWTNALDGVRASVAMRIFSAHRTRAL